MLRLRKNELRDLVGFSNRAPVSTFQHGGNGLAAHCWVPGTYSSRYAARPRVCLKDLLTEKIRGQLPYQSIPKDLRNFFARFGSPGKFSPRSAQHPRNRSHIAFGSPNSARITWISSANSFTRSASAHCGARSAPGWRFCLNRPHLPFAHSFKQGIRRDLNSSSSASSRWSFGDARILTP